MTVWQIIRLIPLILEAVKIAKKHQDKIGFPVSGVPYDYILKLKKKNISPDDVDKLINFALLILKLTGKG
jgi:hypothetical protein